LETEESLDDIQKRIEENPEESESQYELMRFTRQHYEKFREFYLEKGVPTQDLPNA